MEVFNALADFETLFENHAELERLADELRTPNSEDDVFIKSAIVGFSHHGRTEEWGKRHFDFIQHKRQTEFSDRELAALNSDSYRVGRFACLCLGYLLGLYQGGKISDEQFHTAEAQLCGFIMLKLPEFTK